MFVRIKFFRRVYADDLLVLTAWVMLLVSAIIWQTQQVAMYLQFASTAGTNIPAPDMLEAESKFHRAEAAILVMYYTSLWIVKLSFLVFFRRLDQKLKSQRIWWWCVLIFTLATWASCIGSMSFKCLLRPVEYFYGKYACFTAEGLILIVEAECDRPPVRKYQRMTQIHNCVVDVVSDVASEISLSRVRCFDLITRSYHDPCADVMEYPYLLEKEAYPHGHLLSHGHCHYHLHSAYRFDHRKEQKRRR